MAKKYLREKGCFFQIPDFGFSCFFLVGKQETKCISPVKVSQANRHRVVPTAQLGVKLINYKKTGV